MARRERDAVGGPGLPRVVGEGLGAERDLGPGLGERLALLGAEQRGDVVGPALQPGQSIACALIRIDEDPGWRVPADGR